MPNKPTAYSDLLSLSDWTRFTDTQLALAIRLAKVRAVQTFNLMRARSDEAGTLLPLASAELYAHHCILTSKAGEKRLEEWDGLRIIDWCDDPRVYHFCTLYDRYYRTSEDLPYPRQCPILLRQRVNYAYAKLNQIQSRAAHDVLAAALAPAEIRTQLEFTLSQTQQLLNASIKMAMLVTMNLNAYMDGFLSR